MPHRLRIFISSTGDLKAERDAVESVLAERDIDGERFETWPSTPNHPIAECLRRVEECDAFILLLGKRYGTPSPSKSGTHLEYDHVKAITPKRPVFAYPLDATEREPKQEEFIGIVRQKNSLCRPISDIQELKTQVRRSLNEVSARCFRSSFFPPATASLLQSGDISAVASLPINLSVDPDTAFQQLLDLYNRRQDMSIYQVVEICEARFNTIPRIMNLLFTAQVNLAMQGVQIKSESLLEAVTFWDTAEAKKNWASEGLNYNQGNALGALGLRPEAIIRYKAALVKKPDFAQCWVNLGNAHYDVGDVPAATECYEKALNIEPDLFEALYSSATVAIRAEQDFGKALSYLNRISTSQLSPKRQAAIHAWKANALLKLHRYAEGIAEAENAITNSPDSDWAWQVAGRLYALARRDDKKWLNPALKFWQRFIVKYPSNARAWAEIGYVCWSLRRFKDEANLSQQALNAFEKSIELGLDDNGWVSDRIGHLYQEKGNWVEAEKAYRRAYSVNAGQFGYCLGISLMDLERHADALPLLLAAAEQYQPDAMSWHNVAICYEWTGKTDAGNMEKAEAAYKKAIEIDPNYAAAWFNLGGYYWNQGDHLNAYSTWEVAMQKFPKHQDCERVKKLLADPFQKK